MFEVACFPQFVRPSFQVFSRYIICWCGTLVYTPTQPPPCCVLQVEPAADVWLHPRDDGVHQPRSAWLSCIKPHACRSYAGKSTSLGLPDFPVSNLSHVARILVSPPALVCQTSLCQTSCMSLVYWWVHQPRSAWLPCLKPHACRSYTGKSTSLGLPDFPVSNLTHVARIMVRLNS